MNRINDRCRNRNNDRSAKSKARRPVLEVLEDRKLLYSTLGAQWHFGSRITYSFMPDGTNIGGVSSNLFSTMNSQFSSTSVWQSAIEKAAALWAQAANINLTLVSDNGEPYGSSGNQQDDPNVGDIRIGALPQQSGYLAVAMYPPPLNGGTDAGDIFFNSSQTWGSSGYDLETVALHEIGHALGLSSSSVLNAAMYETYASVKSSLNADDISGIQAIYGTIPAPSTNNRNSSTATNITSLINGNLQIALSGQNIASSTQYDWYSVTVPSGTTGSMVVTLQSSNLSSLSPKLTIYNSSNQGLGQSLAQNTYGATVSYTITGVTAGQVYYLRAGAANSGAGGNGAYGLLVNFGSQSQAAIAPPNTVVAGTTDLGGGSDALSTPGGSSHHHRKGHGHSHVGSSDTVKIGNLTHEGDALSVRSVPKGPHHAFKKAS